ncbi:hypothetical protein EYF80_054722 [Liparis tanakae]|uniref:Uncharacterized protein n=1 Tax=Liparis tanakae TaxID=230148 RepID=A0A4Z2F1T4_9TELE|nr:hypothetical protein EYF80_054722 [Liparis tanakae]
MFFLNLDHVILHITRQQRAVLRSEAKLQRTRNVNVGSSPPPRAETEAKAFPPTQTDRPPTVLQHPRSVSPLEPLGEAGPGGVTAPPSRGEPT